MTIEKQLGRRSTQFLANRQFARRARKGPLPAESLVPRADANSFCQIARENQGARTGATAQSKFLRSAPHDVYLSARNDPATRARTGGDSPVNCQFGNSGRNSVRGLHYTSSDIYITKTFPIREGITFRLDTEMFNAFNHPYFALPSEVESGVPGVSVPARFGTLESTISPPTGLLGVGLRGDSSPRMIAFQCRIEF